MHRRTSVSEGNAANLSTSKERNVRSFSGAPQQVVYLNLRAMLFKRYRFLNRQMFVLGDTVGNQDRKRKHQIPVSQLVTIRGITQLEEMISRIDLGGHGSI